MSRYHSSSRTGRDSAISNLTANLRNMLGLQASDHFAALIVGPPGSGKSVVCKQLVHEYLSEGLKVLYALTERTPTDIIRQTRMLGWDIEKYLSKGNLRFADLYSWQVDGNQGYEETTFGCRLCPLNGSELQMAIQRTMERIEGGGLRRIVADSLTTFTSLVGEHTASRAIRILGSRIRETGAGVGVMTSGIHSPSFQAEMYSFFDLVFEIKIEVEERIRRYFRITKYTEGPHPEGWIPFRISDHGIVIESPSQPVTVRTQPRP